MWAEAIINIFARETGKDHDFKTKKLPLLGFFLLKALLVLKNRTSVGNENSFLGRLLGGGVHKQRKLQAVSSMYITYDLY